MKRRATDWIHQRRVWLACQDGLYKVNWRDGSSEHEQGLASGSERIIEGGANLIEEGHSILRRALVHLHALEPNLYEPVLTWCNWSLIALDCMRNYNNNKGSKRINNQSFPSGSKTPRVTFPRFQRTRTCIAPFRRLFIPGRTLPQANSSLFTGTMLLICLFPAESRSPTICRRWVSLNSSAWSDGLHLLLLRWSWSIALLITFRCKLPVWGSCSQDTVYLVLLLEKNVLFTLVRTFLRSWFAYWKNQAACLIIDFQSSTYKW